MGVGKEDAGYNNYCTLQSFYPAVYKKEELTMKKFLVTVLIILSFTMTANAQVEKGDSEIRFLFYYSHIYADEFSSGGRGSLQISYGYFLIPNLQIGIGPQMTFTRAFDGTKTKFSGSVYFTFNLTTASKTVPYINAEFYQMDFSPEWGDFLDYSYINIGLGVRNFFTEYMALNSAITYGFSLATEAEGGMLMIITGLSFIF